RGCTVGYYMPPRHAARLLNSACRAGRLARLEARGRQPAELSTSSIGIDFVPLQLPIYWANESLAFHCANAYFTYFYQQI
ncbi:MAG: hypothetical protein IJB33_08755, partial [Akkermansia sp.]|nr:hypothetical protein [Akkermansia sp.]